jgi:proteasome lid subunit RPN8/RPN11
VTVQIRTPVMRHIEACAVSRFPEEACGLLVGRHHDGTVIVSDRRNHFEVDPGLRLRLQRTVREQGDDIVGIFHSHPSGDPTPSATDQAAIWEPDLLWLITAVQDGAVGDTHAYAAQNTAPPGFRRLDMERA